MADHFFGMNRGQSMESGVAGTEAVVNGTSTGATDVEVRIADAAGLTKQDVSLILERIELFIQQNSNFPIL